MERGWKTGKKRKARYRDENKKTNEIEVDEPGNEEAEGRDERRGGWRRWREKK